MVQQNGERFSEGALAPRQIITMVVIKAAQIGAAFLMVLILTLICRHKVYHEKI